MGKLEPAVFVDNTLEGEMLNIPVFGDHSEMKIGNFGHGQWRRTNFLAEQVPGTALSIICRIL